MYLFCKVSDYWRCWQYGSPTAECALITPFLVWRWALIGVLWLPLALRRFLLYRLINVEHTSHPMHFCSCLTIWNRLRFQIRRNLQTTISCEGVHQVRRVHHVMIDLIYWTTSTWPSLSVAIPPRQKNARRLTPPAHSRPQIQRTNFKQTTISSWPCNLYPAAPSSPAREAVWKVKLILFT